MQFPILIGNLNLIHFCSIFFKFCRNGDILELKAWSPRWWKIYFCSLNIERARALKILLTFLYNLYKTPANREARRNTESDAQSSVLQNFVLK